MIDLMNLISNQPKIMDGVIIGDDVKSEDKTELNGTAFVLLMAQLLSAGDELETDETGEDGINLVEEAELADDSAILLESQEGEDVDETVALDEDGKADLGVTAETVPQMAWFESSSFQPPSATVEIPQADLKSIKSQGVDVSTSLKGEFLSNTLPSDQELPSVAVDETGEVKSDTSDLLAKSVISDSAGKSGRNEADGNDLIAELEANTLQKRNKLSDGAKDKASQLETTKLTVDNNFDKNTMALSSTQLSNTADATKPQIKLMDLPVNVNDNSWGDQFTDQIVWLSQQKVKSAQLKLNPPDLGPLEISVKVVKDTATVNIASHSAHVRDLVEQAVPKLRDMMAEQGLNLSDVNVESNNLSQSFYQDDNKQLTGNEEGSNNQTEEVSGVTWVSKRKPEGAIDYFV